MPLKNHTKNEDGAFSSATSLTAGTGTTIGAGRAVAHISHVLALPGLIKVHIPLGNGGQKKERTEEMEVVHCRGCLTSVRNDEKIV